MQTWNKLDTNTSPLEDLYNTDFIEIKTNAFKPNGNWDNLEYRNKVAEEYLMNGIITTQVSGVIPFDLEWNLQRPLPISRKDNKTDARFFPEPSLIALEMPLISTDIRAGINTRDTRPRWSPRSTVSLPNFEN